MTKLAVGGLACAMAGTALAADLSGRWHVTAKGIDADISLPGTLGAAGLGTRWTERDFQTTMDLPQADALAQEWQFVGPADYRREIDLSAADCENDLELFLERVMWRSEAWFDGVKLGACDSLATPHVHPLPRALLKPGRHELCVRIDNSCFYNFSRNSHAYGPSMQAVWNGVLGRVELRRAHPLRKARVFADASGRLEVDTAADVIAVDVEGLEVSGWTRERDRIVIRLGQEPVAWSDSHPQLYTLRLKAKDGFSLSFRFGFRTVGTRGHAITLNGNDIFLRGNIENANFAKDGVPWMKADEWKRIFRVLKDEDGVNAIRFHSWTPPAAAFEAADELGLFLQPEAGIWTDMRWMKDADELGNGKPVDDFARRELKAISDAYGNSPSFLSLALGNELGGSNFETLSKWVGEMEDYDPRMLHFASTARTIAPADRISVSHVIPGRGLTREKLFPGTDWDYEADYATAKIPTVAHEIGQWPVYPRWDDLLPKFTGVMRPWNLSRYFETAKANGTLRFESAYHEASAKLSRLIYKEEVESFLRTPSCAGVQLLSVQDYTGQAEALVGWRDPFYGLKPAFRPLPAFRTVWGSVSFLARFEKFTWVADETYRARLLVRNMMERTIPAGTDYPYELCGRKGTVRTANDILPGHVGEVGEVSLPLTEAMVASKQTLRFGDNSWSFWVYPDEDACALPAGVLLVSDPEEMKKAILAGRTVLYTGPSRMSGKGRFKPVYWSANWFSTLRRELAALGTWFDAKHPSFRGFVTEDFTDWQWYGLAKDGIIHELHDMPQDFRPIGLSVNDFHFSILTATMFEVTVGKGRLFVCGYDLGKADPVTRRLRASLSRYLSGPIAKGTVAMGEDWLARQFDVSRKKDAPTDAVFDERPAWKGRAYKTELKGFAPVTGVVRLEIRQVGDILTAVRGLLEGRAFKTAFIGGRDKTLTVDVPIIREDMLDGAIELSVNATTGGDFAIDRIRVLPRVDE